MCCFQQCSREPQPRYVVRPDGPEGSSKAKPCSGNVLVRRGWRCWRRATRQFWQSACGRAAVTYSTLQSRDSVFRAPGLSGRKAVMDKCACWVYCGRPKLMSASRPLVRSRSSARFSHVQLSGGLRHGKEVCCRPCHRLGPEAGHRQRMN